ncbi:MAG: cysteine hydrolase [Pseudomonadota bacterium]|nr:cysteine hydrolase [Pseudomonadota bacterium]
MSSPALLVIDLQKGFVDRGMEELPRRIEVLFDRYEHLYATRFINTRPLYEQRLGFRRVRQSPETDLAFAPPPHMQVFSKSGYGLHGTGVIEALQTQGITQVHLCGCDTDACVLAAAYGLWDAGIAPFVLEHATMTSAGESSKQAALTLFRRQFGKDCII